MLKLLHSTIHQTLYISSTFVSANLANCYDVVHHALCSIVIQAFSIPILSIQLMLSCLEMMSFLLHTAHGVAEKPFDRTLESPFPTLGQGWWATSASLNAGSLSNPGTWLSILYGHYVYNVHFCCNLICGQYWPLIPCQVSYPTWWSVHWNNIESHKWSGTVNIS